MESLQDVWLSYPAPCWWSTTSNRARQDRYLLVQDRRHPFVNAIILRNELRNAVGVNMSTQTVRNRIRHSGLRSRISRIRIPLTRLHKQARLNWTQDHVNWTYNDWDPVLFTDETTYCLDCTARRARVWRRRDDRFEDANISEHDRYGGGSIMVWAGISRGGRTDIHIVMRGMMTGVRYRYDNLDVYVIRYLRCLCNRTPVHPHGRQRSTSSCHCGLGVPPAGDNRLYGLASIPT